MQSSKCVGTLQLTACVEGLYLLKKRSRHQVCAVEGEVPCKGHSGQLPPVDPSYAEVEKEPVYEK